MIGRRYDWLTILGRGMRKRCPQCGEGKIFSGWHNVAERCGACDLDLDTREGDTWAFMYISTAGLTGLFFVVMLLVRPANLVIARGVLLPLALVVIVGTLPLRKSIAIAFDYYSELRWDNHRHRRVLQKGDMQERSAVPSNSRPARDCRADRDRQVQRTRE